MACWVRQAVTTTAVAVRYWTPVPLESSSAASSLTTFRCELTVSMFTPGSVDQRYRDFDGFLPIGLPTRDIRRPEIMRYGVHISDFQKAQPRVDMDLDSEISLDSEVSASDEKSDVSQRTPVFCSRYVPPVPI
ncbi:MAG: hypothetical protein PHE53_07620 [Thermoguttaceae bacterium]|nr:hypothetical protein [Thermoguttaceae bacterium]